MPDFCTTNCTTWLCRGPACCCGVCHRCAHWYSCRQNAQHLCCWVAYRAVHNRHAKHTNQVKLSCSMQAYRLSVRAALTPVSSPRLLMLCVQSIIQQQSIRHGYQPHACLTSYVGDNFVMNCAVWLNSSLAGFLKVNISSLECGSITMCRVSF